MPELPEVETMRRGIAGLVGGRILDVQSCPCRLKPIALTPGLAAFRRSAVDRTIERIDRAGNESSFVWIAKTRSSSSRA